MAHLRSWRWKPAGVTTSAVTTLEEIPILHALEISDAHRYPAIPWQISRHAVAKVWPARAFRIGDACFVISDPETAPIRVHGFFSTSNGWEDKRRAMRGLLARFPDREVFAPAIFPGEFGDEIFEPLGFARDPLTQFLMQYDFQR